MQQIQLNIIQFKPVVDSQTFAIYGENQKGYSNVVFIWDEAAIKKRHKVLHSFAVNTWNFDIK